MKYIVLAYHVCFLKVPIGELSKYHVLFLNVKQGNQGSRISLTYQQGDGQDLVHGYE